MQAAQGNILVLDGLQDPGNLGTILRTAAAAGYGGAVILKGTADVYAPKVTRAAAGALFRLPLFFAENAAEAAAILRQMGKTIVGTTPAAASRTSTQTSQRTSRLSSATKATA
jgi:TrmH family RNA methyltransferase